MNKYKDQYLIVGANFINKGAEAMLKTVQQEILKRVPNARIYAICHPLEDKVARQAGIIPVCKSNNKIVLKLQELTLKVNNKLRMLLGASPLPFTDYSPMAEIRSTLTQLKMVVDVSGFAYGDKRGYLQPLEAIKVIDFSNKQQAPYIFMPQAWGDFKNATVADNSRQMLQKASAFFARDHVSRTYLSRLLQKDIEKIPLLPDIAFHFPIPNIDGSQILKQYGYKKREGKLTIGISPNMRIYERMEGKGNENAYVVTLLQIIERLKEQFQVILIPNEILPEGFTGNDDRLLGNLLYDNLGSNANCTLINGYHTAEEIKSVIRECDLVIASRFHSLVFALSLGIPSIAVSWSHKYKELFRLFNLEEFVVEDNEMNTESILALFERLLQKKDSISASINATLPELKKSNATVFDLIQ